MLGRGWPAATIFIRLTTGRAGCDASAFA
jgi:hypothetical protein